MELFWYIIEFIGEITLGLMVFIAIKGLYEDSIVLDKKVILSFLLCGLLSVWGTYIDPTEKHLKQRAVPLILQMIIFLFLLFRGDKKRIVQRIRSLVEVIFIYIFSVCGYIGSCYVLLHKDSILEAGIDFERRISLALPILQIIISIILYRELLQKGICLQHKLGERLFLLVLTMAGMMIFVVIEFVTEEGSNTGLDGEMPIRILLTLLLSVLYFAIPFLMMKNKLSTYYEIGQRHQQEINALELAHFVQYKEAQKETRAFRHDIVNHLLAIQMLQNSEKVEEAKAYVADLLGKIQSFSPKVVTGCEMLDCILSSKLERMNQSKIAFSMDGVMDHGLELKAIDICSIFANAIDNAIEACEERESNRNIWMSIKKTASFYCISIENTFPDDRVEKNLLAIAKNRFTTKPNKELHGPRAVSGLLRRERNRAGTAGYRPPSGPGR